MGESAKTAVTRKPAEALRALKLPTTADDNDGEGITAVDYLIARLKHVSSSLEQLDGQQQDSLEQLDSQQHSSFEQDCSSFEQLDSQKPGSFEQDYSSFEQLNSQKPGSFEREHGSFEELDGKSWSSFDRLADGQHGSKPGPGKDGKVYIDATSAVPTLGRGPTPQKGNSIDLSISIRLPVFLVIYPSILLFMHVKSVLFLFLRGLILIH